MDEGSWDAVSIGATIGIFGLLTVGGVVVAILGGRERRKRHLRDYQAAAREFGAFFHRPNADRYGRLEFEAHGRRAEAVFVTGTYEPEQTLVTVDMRGVSPGCLGVAPERLRSRLASLLGAQDVQVGDPEFDARFVIKSAPESLARRVFGNRRLASSVLGFSPEFPLRLQLTRQTFSARYDRVPEDKLTLVALVGLVRDLVGAILERKDGVEILWKEERDEEGTCQVCGTEMKTRVVRCLRCDTPHHEDCWIYTGECSTYACKEKRYRG